MNKMINSKSLPKSRQDTSQESKQQSRQKSNQNFAQEFSQDLSQDFSQKVGLDSQAGGDSKTALLEVRDLCFWHFVGLQKIHILKHISFCLERGEILSILGRNGAGKTTLLKCLLGFLKSSGDIRLQGIHITELGRTMWDKVSYVAQTKGAILPISALEMVVLGLNNAIKFQPKEEHFARSREVLTELGVSHLADKNCSSLSGGELQMVLFARALVKRPQILILDEPESNLDFANQKMILDTLKCLSKQGVSIVLNTHFPAHALFLSHKVLLLSKLHNDGKVDSNAVFGTSTDLLDKSHLSNLYGVPLEIHSMGARDKENGFVVRI